jgi:uncharacterized membrane protein (UPF0127 family)
MSNNLKLVLLAILILTVSCEINSKQNQSSTPIKVEFTKEGELYFFKRKSDSLIAKFDIEIAKTDYETQRGLMDRYTMKSNQGMLFIFTNTQPRSFYMKNTYIPLDIIYLDSDGKIVSFLENAKPLDETSIPSQVPAKYVFEINGGMVQSLNLEIGDKIEFKEY